MIRVGAVAVVALVALAACTTDGASNRPGELSVVATTTIWGDVVGSIVGDDATVEVLIPLGADAHDYQPSARQVALLQSADLVVANGLGLEEGLSAALDTAAADGAEVLHMAPLLDPVPLGKEGNSAGSNLDPHVWMDPVRMAEAARLIAERLQVSRPAIDWASRADVFANSLLATDEAVASMLSSIRADRRRMVTNHDALGYFADRYGLEIVGVVVPGGSTLADPSSAQLAALVDTMRREGLSVIFGETTQPTALAEAVAAELGTDVKVVELYTESLGGAGSGADTLAGMLTVNAQLIAEALG